MVRDCRGRSWNQVEHLEPGSSEELQEPNSAVLTAKEVGRLSGKVNNVGNGWRAGSREPPGEDSSLVSTHS